MNKQLLEAARAALDALSCTGEPDDPGHRCTHCDDYVDRNGPVRAVLRDALEAAQREQAQDEHDAVRFMRAVVDKGHRYVLIVEPRDGGSRMQMDSGMRRIEIERMLERFARGAREDARLGGDE